MEKSGRFELGTVLVGVSAAFIFSAVKVALPTGLGAPRPAADESRGGQGSGLRQADLAKLYDKELIAVAGPAGATPDELVRTILQDPTIPRHIRAPFAALAKTKAPRLLAHTAATDL